MVFAPSPAIASTAMPTEVRSCARRRLSTLGSTNSRSHWGESFIFSFLPKLLQEPHIAVEEQLNVVHTVFQNRNAVGTHTEGEAAYFFGIVVHETVHVRVDHTAAQNLDPSCLLTGAARLGAAFSGAAADET